MYDIKEVLFILIIFSLCIQQHWSLSDLSVLDGFNS